MAAHIISYTALIGLIVGFFLAMKRILTRDNYINSLILAFLERGEISKDELIDKMYEYGCKDFRLRRIIARHEATRADYVMIFEKLMNWGNFKKRHRCFFILFCGFPGLPAGAQARRCQENDYEDV